MSFVYLDSQHNEYFVSDEAYAQIAQLVMANKYCTHDYRARHCYTADNPCVGKNICLQHLLEKQRNLTRLDITGKENDRTIYYFTDEEGYVFTSTEDSSEEAKKDVIGTLSFYGFTPPATVASRGRMVNFYAYYSTLYGDIRNASVIVLVYNQYNEKIKGVFLLYKNGEAVELQKRGDHKTLYARAEALVEQTKDTRGQYHINGHIRASRYEADVYEVISQLESAMYDVTRRLQNGNTLKDINVPNNTADNDTNVAIEEEEHGEEPVQQEENA